MGTLTEEWQHELSFVSQKKLSVSTAGWNKKGNIATIYFGPRPSERAKPVDKCV